MKLENKLKLNLKAKKLISKGNAENNISMILKYAPI